MRKWYEKYIGYCFCYDNKEYILNDIFYYEGDNDKKTTAYEVENVTDNEIFNCDLKVFRELISQTNLPK